MNSCFKIQLRPKKFTELMTLRLRTALVTIHLNLGIGTHFDSCQLFADDVQGRD